VAEIQRRLDQAVLGRSRAKFLGAGFDSDGGQRVRGHHDFLLRVTRVLWIEQGTR
jgi:hypothetical protein